MSTPWRRRLNADTLAPPTEMSLIRTNYDELRRPERAHLNLEKSVTSAVLFLAVSACSGSTVSSQPPVEPRSTAPAPLAERPCAPTTNREREESLATPEAAVSLYVESVAANDFPRALRAYAAHEQAARVDFKALVSWVGVFNFAVQDAPAEHPMFVDMNEARARAEMAFATKIFVYTLLTDRDLTGVQSVKSEDEIQKFIETVNPARLKTLKILRIDPPRQSLSAEAQAFFKGQATRSGADEMTARIALYQLADELFWSSFELARYDKTWKIRHFAASFAGRPYLGWVGKTTAAEYEARVQ